MAKVLAIIGATGQQGRAVIDFVLQDADLFHSYKLRAITRNPESETAKALASRGIEVVQADALDAVSLGKALIGVHTLFAMTMADFREGGCEAEFQAGKLIADSAVEQKVHYLVFSSLPGISKLSNGKWRGAPQFDAKEKIEQYIRGLSIKSSFIVPASFMENLGKMPMMTPQKADNGTYVISFHIPGDARLPWIYTGEDLGTFVGSILASPDDYQDKDVVAASGLYSWHDIAAAISNTTSKNVVYKQLSVDEYRAKFPIMADLWMSVMGFSAEYGYYGPDTEESVKLAPTRARGRLTTVEEYLQRHPLSLE